MMSSRYRFCPRCGGPLRYPEAAASQGDPVCSACGFVFYRNSKPTAGALVVRDGRVLLARRAIDPSAGKWDIPGGFLKHGEHPLDGVIRELREETGLEVEPGNLIGMYVDVYRDGEDDPDFILNVYFEAEAVSGEPVAADDVAELRWFAPDDLPGDWAFTHTCDVIADWKRQHGIL
jgi:8-oxo-dGTP diphosphatase